VSVCVCVCVSECVLCVVCVYVCVCVCVCLLRNACERKVVEMDQKHLFYAFLTMHPNIMIVFFYQFDAQILYFNTFIAFLYMFRALLCSLMVVPLLCLKHVQECNKCIKIKNLFIKLVKKDYNLNLSFAK